MMKKVIDHTFGIDRRERINHIIAFLSGLVFFAGWWLIIDVHATNPTLINLRRVYYLPGIFGTVGFIVINSIPTSAVNLDDFYGDSRMRAFFGRFFLFFGFFTSFSSLIGAFFLCINDFFVLNDMPAKWPGVGILLQNICIFTATFLYKFAINVEEI